MFYMVLIQTFVDGSATAKALFDYPDIDSAKAALFSTMASSMANANIASVMCEIINEAGGVLKHERWEREPEEAPTIEE